MGSVSDTATTEAELYRLADQIAWSYYWPGADRDDVQQEARIAAWFAVRAFDRSHGIPLRAFVGMVVHRRLSSAVKDALRRKHEPLNESVPIGYRGEARDDVHERLVDLEEIRRVRRLLPALTDLERDSLARFLNGVPYTGDKSMDNALCRVRRKLRAA